MGKSPSRPHPVPSVATGKKPKYDTSSGRAYEGKRGTKTPTGNRPVPSVAIDTPTPSTPPGPVKKAIKHTPMGTPKRDANRALKGRAGGAK